MSYSLRKLLVTSKSKLFSRTFKSQHSVDAVKVLVFGTSSAAVTRHAYLQSKAHLSSFGASPFARFPHDSKSDTPPDYSSTLAAFEYYRHNTVLPSSHHVMQCSGVCPPLLCADTNIKCEKTPTKPKANLPSEEQLKNVRETLESDLPQYFKKSLPGSMFDDQIVFENRIHNISSKGKSQYILWNQLFRTVGHLRFAFLKVDLLNVTSRAEEGTVVVHWRIRASSASKSMMAIWSLKEANVRKPMKDVGTWYEGLSTYHVGAHGKVTSHVLDNKLPPSSADNEGYLAKIADGLVTKSGGLAVMSQVIP